MRRSGILKHLRIKGFLQVVEMKFPEQQLWDALHIFREAVPSPYVLFPKRKQ